MMDFVGHISRLKTVGRVPPGGRLGHALDGSLFVAGDSVLANAWRLILGEGRHRTCSTVTALLAAANERLLDMERNRFLDERPCPERADLQDRAGQLAEALKDAGRGLENLEVTYATDCAAVAHLQVLRRKNALIIARADALHHALAAGHVF